MRLFWSRLRLHTIANRQKLCDCDPSFPLDAEGNSNPSEGKPVDATDFAEGHGIAPWLNGAEEVLEGQQAGLCL